jgi:hypothetical protein
MPIAVCLSFFIASSSAPLVLLLLLLLCNRLRSSGVTTPTPLNCWLLGGDGSMSD